MARVVAHVVDHPDEAVVEHGQRLIQNLLQRRHGRAPRLGVGRSLRLYFGLLFGGELHIGRSMMRTAGTRLRRTRANPYITSVEKSTMAINAAWNKRYGPGGSTRRLHQIRGFGKQGRPVRHGGEPGSTCVVKVWSSPGMVPPLSGRPRYANDNEAYALAA